MVVVVILGDKFVYLKTYVRKSRKVSKSFGYCFKSQAVTSSGVTTLGMCFEDDGQE